MFIPVSTDAPLYHWPIATVGLIVANVAAFVACVWALLSGAADMETLENLALSYETINPIQWFTSPFLHGGPMHLLGNMFFLWAFGLIVEGKVGWRKFLLIYMGIAVGECILEQLVMVVLVGDGVSLGASSAVFGLMAIALIWAPDNEIECVFVFMFLLFIRLLSFEVKVFTLAMFFLLLEVAEVIFSGLSVSSGLLHLMGVFIGAPIGLWMLQTGRVDCENWDIVSRNEWLHEYDWLCPPERREAIQRAEAMEYDPVAAALANKHSQIDANSTYAKRRQARAGETSGQGGLFTKKRHAKQSAAKAESAMKAAQANPDFNRLSLLLRQAIASNSLNLANTHFARLEQLDIAVGLSDKTLFQLAKLYAGAKQFVAATRPLQIIADRGGEMSHEAWLRLAQIQLKVMRRADLAKTSLQRIQIDGKKITEAQQKTLARRDQLLTMCQTASK
ncbi:rhomboid family intramembrane serine protease [Rhodopirellula halodulae]|uniref:rhomboid family intramembrane serine protease n=1 Tax=Rhodopirellula halodulae TaxID=2894198 RepID=UPI001E3494CE|nr:rhomboid family intramembrane serine protease [Rhodopirellula sp. JC737]MCC9655682.1 rhomboid family intramembrane serine protease [Rhodopirellula sp. JC737]